MMSERVISQLPRGQNGFFYSPAEIPESQGDSLLHKDKNPRFYACVYGRNASTELPLSKSLSVFSPLIEETSSDTVVLDVTGTEALFGSSEQLAERILAHLESNGLDASVAVGTNADAAIHAARNLPGITMLAPDRDQRLRQLPLDALDPSLAGVKPERAEVILETLDLWGLHTLGDLANLPRNGVAQTLGAEGLALRQLAKGVFSRPLNFIKPALSFKESLELEYPIELLDQLSVAISMMLDQMCSKLIRYGLAACAINLEARLEDKSRYSRCLRLPFPMLSSHWITRLLLLDIETNPPQVGIQSVNLSAEPARPRTRQEGLFEPLSPEPEKLEMTLVRLGRLVGKDRVGSPELLNDHHSDAFRVKTFSVLTKKGRFSIQRLGRTSPNRSLQSFRIFRPALKAQVESESGRLTYLKIPEVQILPGGRIVFQSGPWRASGRWWSDADQWSREEWEVAVSGGALYMIFQEAESAEWYVGGAYD